MKEFTNNDITLVFYKKENDEKYSFYIKDDKELTERVLSTVKTKRVKEKNINYAVKGVFNLIENNKFKSTEVLKMEKNPILESSILPSIEINPIIELSELSQKVYGKNIETKVTGKTGADHCPVITVLIQLPDGRKYEAKGRNKKEAKKIAASYALAHFYY